MVRFLQILFSPLLAKKRSCCSSLRQARGLIEFLGIIMIERFLNCVVVRSRGCSRVMLEQEGMFLCQSCLELKQQLDNVKNNGEVEVNKIEDKFENDEDCHVDVKMEPEVQVNDGGASGDEEEFVSSFLKSEPMTHVSKQLKTKLKCPDETCKRKFGKYKALVKHCQESHHYFDEELAAKLSQARMFYIRLTLKLKIFQINLFLL